MFRGENAWFSVDLSVRHNLHEHTSSTLIDTLNQIVRNPQKMKEEV